MTTTEQTKANGIIQTLATELDGHIHTDVRGDLSATMRSGSKRVVAYTQLDGTVHVVTDIDYGSYGSSWCGSNSYKTAAGALRYARHFLKVA